MASIARRRLLWCGASLAAIPQRVLGQTSDDFDRLLTQATADPDVLDAANAERERYQIVPGDPSGAQTASRRRRSTRPVSERARQLLISFEVSSRSVYERRYIKPIWPGGASGVTIGIGYDIGHAARPVFEADWQGLIPTASINTLSAFCGVTGASANQLAQSANTVEVTWDQAAAQFEQFLPYAIGQTDAIFPNCAELSEDSLGALVSLVYNRGPSLSPTSSRRREMREIFTLMGSRSFAGIPQKIRDMKRLWPGATERGLIARRELEATLFERGLRNG